METIVRKTTCARCADVVIYRGEARWVEVANDPGAEFAGQAQQIIDQIDQTLVAVGSSKDRLLEIVIYLSDLKDVPTLNSIWDAWVDPNHPPIRACVQVGLQNHLLAEFIIRAAV